MQDKDEKEKGKAGTSRELKQNTPVSERDTHEVNQIYKVMRFSKMDMSTRQSRRDSFELNKLDIILLTHL